MSEENYENACRIAIWHILYAKVLKCAKAIIASGTTARNPGPWHNQRTKAIYTIILKYLCTMQPLKQATTACLALSYIVY